MTAIVFNAEGELVFPEPSTLIARAFGGDDWTCLCGLALPARPRRDNRSYRCSCMRTWFWRNKRREVVLIQDLKPVWTKTAPASPGYYWAKRRDGWAPEPVEVRVGCGANGELEVVYIDAPAHPLEDVMCAWGPRLVPPEGP